MSNLLIPTNRRPTLPGEVLSEDFLKPLGITQDAFAKRIGVTHHRLNEIINGKRSVTSDTALRLGQVLGTGPEVWLNMQLAVDLYDAMHSPKAAQIATLERLPQLSGVE